MSGVFPESYNGALPVRDSEGLPIDQPNIQMAYIAPATFSTSCDYNFLPSDCTARLSPVQINSFQSELLALGVAFDPNGSWNCLSTHNLADLFGSWISDTLPGLISEASCEAAEEEDPDFEQTSVLVCTGEGLRKVSSLGMPYVQSVNGLEGPDVQITGEQIVVHEGQPETVAQAIDRIAVFPSRASLAASSVPSTLNYAIVAGYDSGGDGVIAAYKKVDSNPGAGGVLTQNGVWFQIEKFDINAAAFGAKGNGSTNDTVALQNAINFAARIYATNYWSGYFARVNVPAGDFLIDGLYLSQPIALVGEGSVNTSFSLRSGANRHVIQVLSFENTANDRDTYRKSAHLQGFAINGNGGGQTASSDGIHVSDSTRSLGDQYDGSIIMDDVIIRSVRNCGVYGGRNRNYGYMTRCHSVYSGTHALQVKGYDWRFAQCDLGNAGNNCINLPEGGAHNFQGCYTYMAGDDGILIASAVNATCMFTGGYIDSHQKHGVNIDAGGDPSVRHLFTGNVYRDNGKANDAVYAHNFVRNAPGAVIESNSYIVLDVNSRPAYLIYLDGSSKNIQWSGSYETANVPKRPYGTAICNNMRELILSGDANASLRKLGNSSMLITGAAPKLNFWDESSPANNRNFQLNCANQALQLNAMNDDNSLKIALAQFGIDGSIRLQIPGLGMKLVEVGAADSAGTGFRSMRVAN